MQIAINKQVLTERIIQSGKHRTKKKKKTKLCNLKRNIKTPTNFGKCLNCTTGILGLSKRFQTLASTD